MSFKLLKFVSIYALQVKNLTVTILMHALKKLYKRIAMEVNCHENLGRYYFSDLPRAMRFWKFSYISLGIIWLGIRQVNDDYDQAVNS